MRDGSGKRNLLMALAVGAVYFFSNPNPQFYYDYTFRIAGRLLQGALGLGEAPPRHLNEFVPLDGAWYSVFPLGSVVAMIPAALLTVAGAISEMPAAPMASLASGASCWFLLKIGSSYELPFHKILLTSAAVLFGTWVWTNLSFGGAWQLALGFAMVGELGAIYFTVFDRRALLSGAFFALGFGNRTEVLLTAPVFILLLARYVRKTEASETPTRRDHAIRSVAKFCVVPFVLGVATLAYNHVRFGSPIDFGYARIPGVLEEPWYNHGIFSIYYIPRQAWEMLLKPWEISSSFPYLMPEPFSSSILISSPFLLFIFRRGAKDRFLKYAAWASIVPMTILLWTHGNSGGWQFGYRYWMVCLPWVFVILLETSTKRVSRIEWAVYAFSFAANAYALWLFNWTDYLKP